MSVWEFLDFYHVEITIPSLTLPSPSSDNDVAITNFAISLKTFNKRQIKQINTFRLALKVCFIYDLLRLRSNRIMDCYQKGSKDKFSKSLFNWPKSVPGIKDIKTWRLFLHTITTTDKVLLRTINSSRSSSCHRMSVVQLYTEQQLMQIEGDNQQWFSLGRSSRNMINLWYESAPISHQLQPCFLEEVGLKVKIQDLHSAEPPIQMHSLDEHYSNSTHFYTPRHSFPHLMKNNTLCFVVDGSFYPERSTLVSAAWRCSLEEKLLVTGSFISSVALEYRHPYSAELCDCLSIIKFIDWIASKHKFSGLKVSIGTECQSVINRLIYTPTVTSFSTSMYQVLKEIRKITADLDIKLHVFNIKAHQDDVRNFSDLSFVERENVACDLASKSLICNAGS